MHIPNKEDSVVGWVTVRYHANGSLSVSGTIGDTAFAKSLLDHAKDALSTQGDRTVVVPNRDVVAEPYQGLRDVGDMAPHERGDP